MFDQQVLAKMGKNQSQAILLTALRIRAIHGVFLKESVKQEKYKG